MPERLTRRDFVRHSAALGAAAALGGRSASAAEAPKFRPRFAICNETFRKWPFEKAFGFAAECGYTGIEIAPFTINNDVRKITPEERANIRKQAEAAGLEVVGLHWLLAYTEGLHPTSPDREVRQRTAAYLGELARFCAELGGKKLIFGSPKQRNLAEGVSREEGMEYATDVIREALPTLEKHDILLALEPLSKRITNFLPTAADAEELIERVDSKRCRLILDCAAMAQDTKPHAELVRAHREHLVHFHANDPNSQGPGFGELDFVPIFEALREIGFEGWVSVEVFNYKPGPERLARESIEYMKKVLEKVNRG